MKEVAKIIRNVVVFGIIYYTISCGLNLIVDKILNLFSFDGLYDTHIILCSIIIIHLIAMIVTKKIVSIKIKIYYEEAKRMLLILLIIFLIINVVTFILSYNYSLKIEKGLNDLINSVEEVKISDEYKYFNEKEKQNIDNLYKIYTEGKEEMMELEKQRLNLNIIKSISKVFLYVVCLYAFGLFLYRKDKNAVEKG